MPQSPQQDDYLKKTLQESSTLTDAQRQAMWDVFHQSKNPSDFVSRINSSLPDMDDSAKQTLYDLRYNPSKYMDANGNPIPPGGKAVSAPPTTSKPPVVGPQPQLEPATHPAYYGFTPSNILEQSYEGVKGLGTSLIGMGKDLLNPTVPVIEGKDSLLHKYITGPASEQEQAATTAKTPIESIGHSIAESIPLVGPWAASLGQQAGRGDIGGALAQGVGGVVAGELVGRGVAKIAKPVADIPKSETPTTTPRVPTQEVPIEVAPPPETQPLAKSQSMSVSETAIPEMHPAEKAQLEEQAGRSLSTADAQKLRIKNVQNEAVNQMLSGAKPVDIVEQVRAQAPEVPKVVEVVKPPLEDAAAEPTPAKLDAADDAISKQINATPKEQLPVLQQAFLERAQAHLSQATAIRNLVELSTKNEANARSAIDLKSTGGPIRSMVIDEEGNRAVVKPTADVGPFSRDVLAEASGQESRFKLSDDFLKKKPGNIPQDAWDNVVKKVKTQYTSKRAGILKDIELARDTQQPLEETDIPSRLKDLDETGSLIYKIPDAGPNPGRRAQLPPPIDEKGNLTDSNPLWTMDLKTAQRLMGSKVKQMPSMDELLAKAIEKENLANFNLEASKRVSDKLNGQRGAIGSPSLKRVVRPTLSDEDFTTRGLAKLAKEVGIEPIPDTATKRPYSAWMSEDGKTAISTVGSGLTHSELAAQLLEKFGAGNTPVSAMRRFFSQGLIRKVNPFTFQVKELSPKNLAAIDMELIRDGEWNRPTHIEIGDFYSNTPLKHIQLNAGWGDKYGDVGKAIRAELTKSTQRGFAGTTNLASASLGAAVGFHFGGLPGALGGWGIGFITPELLRSPLMKSSIANMRSMLDAVKVPLSDWLRGTPQPEPILPRMRGIIDEQHKDIQGSHIGLMQRMAQIPNDVRRAFTDRLSLLNDQQSHLTNFMLRIDPRGRMIRAGERPSLDDSPFITLYNTATSIRGEQSFNSIQYAKVIAEAKKAGLSTHLDEFLNLHAYNRVYQTLTEHAQGQADIITRANNELKNPQLQPRDRIQLEDDISEARKNLADTLERMQSGKVVPGGYTLTEIHKDMADLQQKLGPVKFQMVQDLAQRSAYSRNRAALDMLHDHGVVSDANYKLFTSRGDQYIPMTRVMSDLATNEGRWSGNGSPAYLRKQNVIHALEGSERVNRSPLVASMDFNNEAISEALRNRAIGEYVQAAVDHPDIYGDYFQKVGPDYRAKEGEMLVGHYANGTPTTYAVPKWLGETLQGVSPVVNDVIGGATARTILNLAKAGATTLNLGFSTMRVATDLSRLAILSEAGLKVTSFPKDLANISKLWVKNLVETVRRGPKWQEAMRQGYTFSGAQRNITPEAFLPAQKLGYTGRINPVRILNGIADVNAAIEDSIKMTAYKRLKLQGYSDKSAIYETKRYGGAPDYSRKGDLSAIANIGLMFFNADIQHITQAFARVADNPKRMIPILAASTAAVMTLAQHNWSQKDENGRPLMRRVPYEERDRDFVFLTGEVHQATGAPVRWRMRKPDFATLIINPVENLMNKMLGREDRTGTQLAIDAIQHATPFTGAPIQPNAPISSAAKAVVASSNPLIRTPIEEMLNQRMYGSGGPIVTNSKIEPQYQYSPTTSPVSIAIGKATGLSPQRIEHVAQSLTGGASNVAFSALSPLFPRPSTINTLPGSPEARRQTPVIGPIEGRFRETDVNQQDQNLTKKFYDNINEATIQYNTFESLLKSNPTAAFAYQKQNPSTVWKGRMASLMSKRISEINEIERITQSNPSIDAKTREESLKNLHDTKMRILESFNGIFDRTVSNITGTSTMGNTAK